MRAGEEDKVLGIAEVVVNMDSENEVRVVVASKIVVTGNVEVRVSVAKRSDPEMVGLGSEPEPAPAPVPEPFPGPNVGFELDWPPGGLVFGWGEGGKLDPLPMGGDGCPTGADEVVGWLLSISCRFFRVECVFVVITVVCPTINVAGARRSEIMILYRCLS